MSRIFITSRIGFLRRLLPVLLLGVLFSGAASGARADAISKEYQLKAAFLYNFAKFVEWPPLRFESDTEPIVIAVLGQSPFHSELEALVENRSVNGRAIRVRSITDAADLSAVHILFVPSGEEHRLKGSIFGDRGVLTVGESDVFADRGGVIRFIVVAGKVRFEINQASSDKAGLRLSGQLLKLATTVRRKP